MSEGMWRHRAARELVRPGVVSYAQAGEDLIARFVLDIHGITRPTYVDVGAHAPRTLSNTFLFYAEGAQGLLIEPNPARAARLRAERSRDVLLERAAASTDDATVELHVLDEDAVSTADAEQLARALQDGRHRVKETVRATTIRLSTAIDRHLGRAPDLVSIDVEGLELDVLHGLELPRHRPLVLIVETLQYEPERARTKRRDLIEAIRAMGFMVWADTFLNTIFVDEARA